MAATRHEVIVALSQERAFQDQKHGTIYEVPHTPGGWMLLIKHELIEAENALIKGGMGRDSWRHEIVQVAALCIACLEQHGLQTPEPFKREI
jgi:hypothetical protein